VLVSSLERFLRADQPSPARRGSYHSAAMSGDAGLAEGASTFPTDPREREGGRHVAPQRRRESRQKSS
jgi:hypothetical protein